MDAFPDTKQLKYANENNQTNVHGIISILKIAGHVIYRYLDRKALSQRFAETHQENHPHNTREFGQQVRS